MCYCCCWCFCRYRFNVVVVNVAFVVVTGGAPPATDAATAFAAVAVDARAVVADAASLVVVAVVAAYAVVAVVAFLVIVGVALKLYVMLLIAFLLLRSVISMTLFDADVCNNNGHYMYATYIPFHIYNILSISYNLSLRCKIPRRV